MTDDNPEEGECVTIDEIMECEQRNMAGCDNDPSCCTFPKGYVTRQAVYACMTCQRDSGQVAGVCYPCAVSCHEGHDIVDLYTKRAFRCDCGNGRFPHGFQCKLWEEKDAENERNIYNHNYKGRFCLCNSEYDEEKETDEMFQCNICEDWFHLRHLSIDSIELSRTNTDSIIELTCRICLARLDFLRPYADAFVVGLFDKLLDDLAPCRLVVIAEKLAQCADQPSTYSFGAPWPEDWRAQLCKCEKCTSVMKEAGVGFLLDQRDTSRYYYDEQQQREEEDANGRKEQLQDLLKELPHAQAIFIAEGIARFKREFAEFINNHDTDRAVTTEDVKNFFDKLNERRFGE